MNATRNETGIPSGFPSLDKITGGWQQSNLIVVASRPSIGKTAFAQNLARNVAINQHIPIAFFSLEMSAGQFAKRLIVQETGVGKKTIDGLDAADANKWLQMEDRLTALSKAPFYVDDTPGLKLAEFKEKAKTLVDEKGIRLIVIDYVQLMNGPEELRGHREEEVSFIIRELKATAKELDVPIIALAQLSKALGKNNYKRPEPGDLRESGALEEVADLIIMLHRPDYLGLSVESKDKEISELIVAKNRNGETGEVSLRFDTSTLSFRESDEAGNEHSQMSDVPERMTSSRLNPIFTFDNFKVSESNSSTVQALKDYAEITDGNKNNPLLLIGKSGSGKTHLANAIGNAAKSKHQELTVLYVSGYDFKCQYMEAVKTNHLPDFRNFYGRVDYLILDNIQDLIGPSVQDIFFHIMDSMQQQGKCLVITSSMDTEALQNSFDERMLKHISWGKTIVL